MLLSGDVGLESVLYQAIGGGFDVDWQSGYVIYDYKRKLTYFVKANAQNAPIIIYVFDEIFNLIGEIDSSVDFSTDIRSSARYCRGMLSENGAEILLICQDFSVDTSSEARLGVITLDFTDFSNSTIVFSPVFTNLNSTNGATPFVKVGSSMYWFFRTGDYYKTDFSSGSNTFLANTNAIFMLGWFTDYSKKLFYGLKLVGTTQIYLEIFDYDSETYLGASTNFIDTVANMPVKGLGCAHLLRYDSINEWFEIAHAVGLTTNFKVGWYDKELNLKSSLLDLPASYDSANGYRNNIVVRSKSEIISLIDDNKLYLYQEQQTTKTIPLLSGDEVSGEQSNKSIPFVQNFNPINVFRMSAEGSIERDNLLIKIMDEYRGFNGLLSSANAADIITSDADFGGEKSMSFSGETYNTGITLKGGLFGILFTWKRNSPNSLNRILLNDDGDFYIDTANGYSLVFSVDSAISWTFPNLTIDIFDANLIYLQVDFLTGEGFVKFGSKTVFISGLTPLGSIDTIFNVINDTSSNGYKTTELNIFNFDTLNNQGEINDFINPKANAITASTGLAWNNLI